VASIGSGAGADDAQAGETCPAEVHDEVAGERVDAEQARVAGVRDDWRPAGPVRQRSASAGQLHRVQPEVLRFLVVQDQQPVGAVGGNLMLDLVLDALPPLQHHLERALRRRGIQQPGLAGQCAGHR
jgi:hypothetical protein